MYSKKKGSDLKKKGSDLTTYRLTYYTADYQKQDVFALFRINLLPNVGSEDCVNSVAKNSYLKVHQSAWLDGFYDIVCVFGVLLNLVPVAGTMNEYVFWVVYNIEISEVNSLVNLVSFVINYSASGIESLVLEELKIPSSFSKTFSDPTMGLQKTVFVEKENNFLVKRIFLQVAQFFALQFMVPFAAEAVSGLGLGLGNVFPEAILPEAILPEAILPEAVVPEPVVEQPVVEVPVTPVSAPTPNLDQNFPSTPRANTPGSSFFQRDNPPQ